MPNERTSICGVLFVIESKAPVWTGYAEKDGERHRFHARQSFRDIYDFRSFAVRVLIPHWPGWFKGRDWLFLTIEDRVRFIDHQCPQYAELRSWGGQHMGALKA